MKNLKNIVPARRTEELKSALVNRLSAEYAHVSARLIYQAVNEADALASLTTVPLLVLPTLAEEKVQKAAAWFARQRSMLRGDTIAFSAWITDWGGGLAHRICVLIPSALSSCLRMNRNKREKAQDQQRSHDIHPPMNLQSKNTMTIRKVLRLTLTVLTVLAGLALGILTILLTGCGVGAAPQPPPPPTVTVAPVEQKELVEWNEFTGRTEAVESVEVRPRVSGYIQEVRFQSGQLVKKGEVLFVIDPRWHQAAFNNLEAEAERANVQLANANREADRASVLLANKAISTEESDQRVARYQEAKSALLAAQAARDSAKLDLDYTLVRAPIDGRVSRAFLTVGNYVSGGPGTSSLLTTLVSVSPVYVYADVDEDSLLKFNTLVQSKKIEKNGDGQTPIELQLADETGFPHSGHIESFDNRVDPNTGSILLRAVFSNDDGRIVPGLFARIRVPLSERHPALLVSERAIGTDQAQKYVLTLTASNTVAYTAVKLGPAVDGKRIVRSGLLAGEKIIVNGMERIRPGMPVTPQEQVADNGTVKIAQR
jgi:RND family efflux transporter MFP subunit